MRLHQCSICGRVDAWTPDWSVFSSLILEESYPHLVARLCSDECMGAFKKKLKDGEIALPKLVNRGYTCDLTHPQEGYKAQPSQEELLRLWNEQKLSKKP